MLSELLRCRLEDGRIVRYAIAFPLDSSMEVHRDFYHLGVGTIHSYNDKPYTLKHKFRFYTTLRKIKKI